MTRVLVTGGAGFIGSHIVDFLLNKDCSVTIIDDFSSGREANLVKARQLATQKSLEFKIIKSSIVDKSLWEQLEAHDYLFHIAAQTSVTVSVQQPQKDYSINIETIPMIMEWVIKNKVKGVFYTNTAGALYGNPSTFPTPENYFPEPQAPYGATKSFFETYFSAMTAARKSASLWSSDMKQDNGFTWCSMRLGNVYGPRQITKGEAGVIPIFIELFEQEKTPKIFGDGSKTRDYVYVLDVVSAFEKSFEKVHVQKMAIDQGYNVGIQQEIKDQEVYDGVYQSMSKLFPSKKLSEKPIYESIRPGEALRSCLLTDKLKKDLGWQAKMSFEEGVKQTVKAYF